MLLKTEVEFKILCNTHQACPEVKRVLEGLGFTDLKDLANSPSFDISAKLELENEQEKEKVAREIFQKCKEKVQSIQITTKN